jgi:hypothetical protein
MQLSVLVGNLIFPNHFPLRSFNIHVFVKILKCSQSNILKIPILCKLLLQSLMFIL